MVNIMTALVAFEAIPLNLKYQPRAH